MRHMETHNIVKRFSCNHCYFSANTLGYMRIHYTRFHPGTAFSSSFQSLPVHLRIHAVRVGLRIHAVYISKYMLYMHVSEYMLYVYISEYMLCTSLVVSLSGLTYTYDAAAASSRDSASAGANQSANVYKCVSCDYLFGNLSDMKRHLRLRHRIHIADMRHSSGQDTLTQIVPMENQDGITSDVQVPVRVYQLFIDFTDSDALPPPHWYGLDTVTVLVLMLLLYRCCTGTDTVTVLMLYWY